MQLRVQCDCGAVLTFPRDSVGQTFRCGNCGKTSVVPPPAAPPLAAPPPAAPPPQRKPPPVAAQQVPAYDGAQSSRGVAGGCLAAALVSLFAVAVCIALLIAGFFWARAKVQQAANQISGWAGLIEGIEQLGNVDEIIEEYEGRGYERVAGQVVVEDQPVPNKRIYTCQMLNVKSDIQDDVAILAQAATIHGTVHGDLDFMGQALIIERGAVVKGDVHSRLAQLITVKGTIEGKLSGGYQALDAAPGRIGGGTTGTQDALARLGSAFENAKREIEDKQRAEAKQRAETRAKIAALSPHVRPLVEQLQAAQSPHVQRQPLEQLAGLTPNDADRDTVVELIVPCMKNHLSHGYAIDAFRVWGTRDHAPLLLELIKEEGRGVNSPRMIVELLIEIDAREEVVALINHTDSGVARMSLETARQWEVDPDTIAAQCLEDLPAAGPHDRATRDRILRCLESQQLDDVQIRSRVSQALIPLIPSLSSSDRSRVFRVLAGSVTEDDLALLVEHPPRTSNREYAELLAQFADPRVYETLVDRALQRNDTYAAEMIRERTGSAAEEFLWPHLKDRSFILRNKALELIGEIGSPRSLPHLKPLLTDTMSKSTAERTIRKIEARAAE